MNRTLTLAVVSIFVGVAVLGLKFSAFYITGSIALFSDALESIINGVTACVALCTLWISSQPADRRHPYGHHKAEYFSAVLEGVLIVLAALLILREAGLGIFHPKPLDAPVKGVLISALGSLLNAGWSWALLHEGKRLKSPALLADGKHLLTDVVTSFGIYAGIGLAVSTGDAWLDPALAILVALYILWSGLGLMRASFSGLLDEAVPEATMQRIRDLIATQGDGALEAHDIRSRHAGRVTFLEFHLVVPGNMTVSKAHAICDRLEAALRDDLDDEVQTTIHIEPEEKAKHTGIVVV